MNCAAVKFISISTFIFAAILISVTKSESDDLKKYAKELQELDPVGLYFGNGVLEESNPEPLEPEEDENDEEKRLRFYGGAPSKRLRFYNPEKRLRFYNPEKRLRFSSVDPTAKKRLRFTAHWLRNPIA